MASALRNLVWASEHCGGGQASPPNAHARLWLLFAQRFPAQVAAFLAEHKLSTREVRDDAMLTAAVDQPPAEAKAAVQDGETQRTAEERIGQAKRILSARCESCRRKARMGLPFPDHCDVCEANHAQRQEA